MSNELESHVEFAHSEPLVSHMDSQEVRRDDDSLPEQSQSENASMQRESGRSGENTSPSQVRDKLVRKIDVPTKSGMFDEIEPNVQFGIEDEDGLHQQFEDVNSNIKKMDAISRRNEESENNIGEAENTNTSELNPSTADGEARDDASTRLKIVLEPQEFHSAKRRRGASVAGKKHIIDSPTNLQIDPEQHEFDVANQHRVKRVAGGKRIRDAHPMRKSLADAGTSFQNGVRKSTRVRMRPLEYWKGERLLYERVDNSLKLIGLKYISPGKGSENLKVKTYDELLEMASRP